MFLKRTPLLFLPLLLSGCLDFGPNVTTTTPSASDVSRCRAEMYIDPDVKIQPKGFKLTSGIDDAIWFKFNAETPNITNVFRDDVVDSSLFRKGFTLHSDSLPSWWDVSLQSLTGGQVSLPNARFMNVGYFDNGDGTLTVYIMWHET